jgi:hypothetical protein
MEIPTARVIKENSYRIGASQIDPYRYYYLTFSPFSGIELNGKVTEILGVKASQTNTRFRGYGNDKDISVEVIFQFLKEDNGCRQGAIHYDPHGHGNTITIHCGQASNFTLLILPSDLVTVGWENSAAVIRGRVRMELLNDRRGAQDAQLFWGVQLAFSEKYAFMVEYNPIKYTRQTNDPARAKYFTDSPPSPYNVGFRWKPFKWTEVDVSYQRGNQVGVNVSMAFDIGQPFLPIYDLPYKEEKENAANPLVKRLTEALYKSGFSNIGIIDDARDLWIRAENNKYYYHTRAIGVIARLVAEIVPPYFQNLHIVLTENDVPLFEI